MATASYRFYVGAIAERLGFDDVIATEAEIDATGRLYAKMVGDNVYGPAKLAALAAWLAREGIDREACHIRFYSDHGSAAQVMGWADDPFAVNPHGPMRPLARKRGGPPEDGRGGKV